MSSYEWQKNCAIVDRSYYFLYTLRATGFIFGSLALKDFYYIAQNYYADRARLRLKKYAAAYLAINAFSYWFNMYPLTKEERNIQWVKYRYIGKLVYGLTFLDLAEEKELKRTGKYVSPSRNNHGDSHGHGPDKEHRPHGHIGH